MVDNQKTKRVSLRSRQRTVKQCVDNAAQILYADAHENMNNVALVSDILGITRQYLYRLIREGRFPPVLASKLHRITHGKVDRKLLNPEVFK